ncbi:hypothetical protein C0431_12870 [bacterium]|nr:hypothetical protein [bacterium]
MNMGENHSLYRLLEPLPGDFFSAIDRNSPIAYMKGRVASVPVPQRFHDKDFYRIVVDDGIEERDMLVREDFLFACDTMIHKGELLTIQAYQYDFFGEHVLFVFDFEKQPHLTHN